MEDQNEVKSILGRLQRVFDSIFRFGVKIRADLSANDVTEWDSLMHVKLILSVEREFEVRFTLGEIKALQNVGDLVELLQEKLLKKSFGQGESR